MKKTNLDRRRFLGGMAGASLAASPLGMLLSMRSALAADDYSNLGDYKALVCVFLHGGNDAINMLVPSNASAHAAYANLRGDLAVPRNTLLPLNGIDHGFHPQLPKLQSYFNQGKLALVSNVGNLIEPVTKQQYLDWEQNGAGGIKLPPELFSHNDQSFFWQTSYGATTTGSGVSSGWAGRMADLMAASNSNPYVPITITLDGHSPWQTAAATSQLGLNFWDGISGFEGLEANDWPPWANDRNATWAQLLDITGGGGNALEKQIVEAIQRTRSRVTEVKAALARTWDEPNDKDIFQTPYNKDNYLAASLRMVARMIHNHADFGQKRQIFAVSIGGWDTHGSQASDHPRLLGELDEALDSFYQTLVEMNLQQQVTTFTSSEFGRTLGVNGDGTDHGWGTHLMVLGDAVSGQQVYGDLPVIELDSPDDIGNALLPKLSTEQYGATLARWFGITNADLDLVFPNLGNFGSSDIGFMS
ncbi:DUF1501 domain-containing protein [Thiolapillus sp.]